MARRTAWWDAFISFLAFVAVILIGIALIIAAVLPSSANNVSNAFITIASIFAYITVAFYSFFFVIRRPRHRIWYIIAWTVAVTLIVLHFILGII